MKENEKKVDEKEIIENVKMLSSAMKSHFDGVKDWLTEALPDGFQQGLAGCLNNIGQLRAACLAYLDDKEKVKFID